MGNSCLTCPSYLKADQAIRKFKKSTGAPMCGRFGFVLGRSGMTELQATRIAEHYAKSCGSHGDPLPPLPERETLGVALANGFKLEHTPDSDLAKKACTSCAMCEKYIPDTVVAKELGWTAALCSATGKLVLPNRVTTLARNCEMRRFGPVQRDTNDVILLPEFEDAFTPSTDALKTFMKQKASGGPTEPSAYPTDRDVSDDEAKDGIRAWRKIVGEGDFHTYLPIFKTEFFDEVERAKIPVTGEDAHPEDYIDHFSGVYNTAVAWMELDQTPMFWGQAGTGKTELYRHIAWLMNVPYERFSITGSTELDDLAGKTLFSPETGTYFQYGRLPLAWSKPCVTVLDEPNTGNPEVWQFLRPLTDDSKQLVLDMNKGESIMRHNYCYMGMAANPSWDPLNVGTQEIGDADSNRLFHIYLELPPDSLEREIILKAVSHDGWDLSKDKLDAMMRSATEIRALIDGGTLPISWGIRPQKKVARALRWFDPITAYRRGIADFLEPEAQAAVLDVVKSHFA